MRVLRVLRHLLGRRQAEVDLAEEMAAHEEMHRRDLEDRGAAPSEAARLARRAFGSGALAANHARDVWLWPWLQDAVLDFRYAIRLLGRDRGFTAVIVLVLGLGIGVAHLQFVLIDAICIRGLPIPDVARVLFLSARDSSSRDLPLSYQEFMHARDATPGLAAIAAFANAPGVLGDDQQAPDRVQVTYVSPPLFRVLGEHPILGRDFEPGDDRVGADPVAILTSRVWRSRYDADPAIVGRVVRINGTPATVIGVMREPLRFPNTADLWRPLSALPGGLAERPAARLLSVAARLTDDGSLTGARDSLAGQAADLSRLFPASNTGITLTAVRINDRYNGRLTDGVWIAFAGVAVVVLLIACSNAANLLLVRAARRGHEMAVRASIGASRLRIVRQMLVESAALAVLSSLAAVVFSVAGLAIVNRFIPENTLAYWMTFAVDARAIVLLIGLCVVTVCLFGLAPALHVARTDVTALMKAGGRDGFAGLRGRRWMMVFLAAECGLTMVLLNAIVMGVRQTRDAGRQFLAVDTRNTLTTWVTLPADRYRTPEARRAFYDAIGERIGAIPGVEAIAMTTALPLGGAPSRSLIVDGQPANQAAPTVWTVTVSRQYFDALGVPLLRGRSFTARDGLAGSEAAIVNQRFVERFLPSEDPIGKRITLADPAAPAATDDPSLTVVGVVPVIRQRTLPDVDPIVYLPMAAAPPAAAALLIRGSAAGAPSPAVVRDVANALDPELPLYRMLPMDQALDAANWNGRVSLVLLNGIAAVAVCLAGIGLYGVMANTVIHRTREIGIRRALGARRAWLVAMMARSACAYLALGVSAGMVCVLGFARLIQSGAGPGSASFQLDDPLTFAGAIAGLGVITLAAAIVPTWRASRIDPARVLRS